MSDGAGQSAAIPGVLGCLTGLGCGLVLLVGCVASFMIFSTATPIAAPTPIPSPPPVTPVPPLVPLPPPPMLPPAIPTAPPGPLSPPTDVAPRIVRATITEVQGLADLAVGSSCELNVDRSDQPDGSFVCNTQIVCGGRLLYGGAAAGYFPCTLYEGPPRHVVGADQQTTAGDGDGAMSLDTHGTLEIWDDATGTNGEFRVRARVDSVE